MAGRFENISLTWDGAKVTIPGNRVLGAITRVEEVITLQELTQYANKAVVPMGRIATAYGAVLRYAGVEVDDDDVYVGLFKGQADTAVVLTAVNMLLLMMVPPEMRTPQKPVVVKGEEDQLGKSKPAAKAQSSGTSKSRSARGGSRRRNSGT